MSFVSVCIATYNGGSFLREQLVSVLSQLPANSEVLVGDDGSTDDTVAIAEGFADPRVRVIMNSSNLGYIRNFENLLGLAAGDYIFFCDQDDVWPNGRVDKMISAMKSTKKLLVVGSTDYFFTNPADHHYFCGFSHQRDGSYLRNIFDLAAGRNVPYFGCSMLISKELKLSLLPFGSPTVSHDIWTFLVATRLRSISHTRDVVTYRRVHNNNLSNRKRSFLDKIITRVIWLIAFFKIFMGKR
ncbi:glycosyltransferase [Pseudomonas fulva]|uniref:glycosyltransferase n=1 Tax=Pseudomonas fulva TaxID=47880 RepID=UPI00201E5255|nr:glycosyltransferase [Pseudomonas fulva]UQY34399.1 glycosyltransferase [Pseudomonas fulva]